MSVRDISTLCNETKSAVEREIEALQKDGALRLWKPGQGRSNPNTYKIITGFDDPFWTEPKSAEFEIKDAPKETVPDEPHDDRADMLCEFLDQSKSGTAPDGRETVPVSAVTKTGTAPDGQETVPLSAVTPEPDLMHRLVVATETPPDPDPPASAPENGFSARDRRIMAAGPIVSATEALMREATCGMHTGVDVDPDPAPSWPPSWGPSWGRNPTLRPTQMFRASWALPDWVHDLNPPLYWKRREHREHLTEAVNRFGSLSIILQQLEDARRFGDPYDSYPRSIGQIIEVISEPS